jgi:phosphonate dehydrogenase
VQTVERVSAVDELLRMSDVLIVCTPLTSETRHLLNRHTLELANPGLLLVNISRIKTIAIPTIVRRGAAVSFDQQRRSCAAGGSCVDEAAAADALASGRLGGYAADVFELEDWALPERPRDIEPRLLHEPHHARTLFTPHLGSAVAAVREEIEGAAAQEIVRLARGEPLMNRVN